MERTRNGRTDGRQAHRYILEPLGRGIKRLNRFGEFIFNVFYARQTRLLPFSYDRITQKEKTSQADCVFKTY